MLYVKITKLDLCVKVLNNTDLSIVLYEMQFPLLFRRSHTTRVSSVSNSWVRGNLDSTLKARNLRVLFRKIIRAEGTELNFCRPVKWNPRMLRLCQITVGWCDVYRVKSKHCQLACFCFYIWKNIDLSRRSAKKTAHSCNWRL